MRIPATTIFILTAFSLVAQLNWSRPFEECGVSGSITVYDYKSERWMMSDPKDSRHKTLPASTFKIVNTLIAIDQGAVKDEHELIKWIDDYDTVKYGHRPNIYHDMSMKEAFQLSAGWVYVELAKKVGRPNYRRILHEINYGNGDLSIDYPDFWNFGTFGVSPINQIETLVNIYERSLPFSERSYDILSDMMVEESTTDYILRAKTGWTRADGRDVGWWVGYVEREDNTYFFATRLIKDRSVVNDDFGKCRKDISRQLLKELNVL